jgi:hypothetical protein
MPLFRFCLVLALALPATSHAQRRDPGRGMARGGARRATPPELRTKDLETMSPARIALERRKDLDLTSDQATRLDSASRAYDLEAKDFGTAIDTLQGIMQKAERNLSGNPTVNGANVSRERPKSAKDSLARARNDSLDQAKADKDQERRMAAKNALASTLLKIREWYDVKLGATNGFLTEDQRHKIGPWFENASEELTARLHGVNGGTDSGRQR